MHGLGGGRRALDGSGGVPRSRLLGHAAAAEIPAFSFVQISDSHIGFANPPNTDTPGTLKEAIELVASQKGNAALMIHTGDVSHLSKPAQFDTADQINRGAGLETHYVPGEHDVLADDGKAFFARFTPGGPAGWYSFDQAGRALRRRSTTSEPEGRRAGLSRGRSVGLAGEGSASRPAASPIVVFAHVPLWTVSQEWGWGTDDGAQALTLLRRFGSVTVLNGHIHQIMQKVEGNVAFHTARSTAFPQPAPGTAPSPGPIKDVPAGRLRSYLGVAKVSLVQGETALAIIDTPLGA